MVLHDCLIKTQHSAKVNSMYRVWCLPRVDRVTDFLDLKGQVLMETPINGGLIYEGPKVAEYPGR